jgi:phosphoribosylanthranilate isomerase
MIKGIKICGVSDLETLKFIVNHPHPPNYVGFITNYKKSKRFVNYEKLKKLLDVKKKNINFVSVMVKPSDEFLKKIENLNFDYYQLYDVSPERTKKIK